MPWATVSEYHKGFSETLGPRECVVQARNISAGLQNALLESGYFEATGQHHAFGHDCKEPIWRLIREDI